MGLQLQLEPKNRVKEMAPWLWVDLEQVGRGLAGES